jgi:hypothetical protein
MADIDSSLRLWSSTASSNKPTGSTSIGAGLDDNLRAIQAVVRQYLASPGTTMSSAATVDLSTADGHTIPISGTTTVTGYGTEVSGIEYLLTATGAHVIKNSSALVLPGASDITTAVGDYWLVESKGSGNWAVPFYGRANGGPVKPLFISVKDPPYNAVGDGVTDDTSAIQAAINVACTSSGRALIFPNGTYKITAALTIPLSVGWKIMGEAVGGSTIKQFTDNTAIFSLTACDTHSFVFENLTLDYNAAQNNTKPNSIAIYFAGTSGTPANGFYQFTVRRMVFGANCYQHFVGNLSLQLAVWGWHIDECEFRTNYGRNIYINPSPSIGIPACSITNCNINRLSSTEASFDITGIDSLTIQNVEWDNVTVGAVGNECLRLVSCRQVQIISSRIENFSITQDSRVGWLFASTQGQVIGAHFGTWNISAGLLGFCAQADGASSVSFENVSASIGTKGGAATAAVFNGGGFNVISNFSWVATPGDYVLYAGAKANLVVVPDRVGADAGDAAASLVPGVNEVTQVWNTPLTAVRAVTLTTASATIWAGAKFRIVRTANATGASALNVGSGPLKALAVGQWCEVEYNGATSAWLLTAFGSL